MQKLLATVAWCALALVGRAQVNVELAFDQEYFLRGESVPVRVKIGNFSGQTVLLGESADWITFTVTGTDGRTIRQSASMPAVKPFQIESAKSMAVRADLKPAFDLSQPGHYKVAVRVMIPALQREFVTDPEGFDVISGTKVWDKEIGVPGTTPPEVRRFSLLQATFLKEVRLYARVTDATESEVIRVTLLGALPSSSKPEAAVDQSSQLHALFQSGQRSFTYFILTPAGEPIIRQTHEITATRPRLRAEEDGRIMVSGGARVVSLADLPPPPPEALATNVAATNVVATNAVKAASVTKK